MGQMQRRKRWWREVTGRCRLKALFRGAARLTVSDLEMAAAMAVPPQSAMEMINAAATNGVTFWFDHADDEIKASA